MIVLCAWCRKQYRKSTETKEWTSVGSLVFDETLASHGMCPICFESETGSLPPNVLVSDNRVLR